MSDLTTLQELMSEDSSDLEAERLILDTTEMLLELMEREQVSRKELADLLGKSKGHVSQILNGERNMTLRTLAEVAHVLGGRVAVSSVPLAPEATATGGRRDGSKIVEMKTYVKHTRTGRRHDSRFARSMKLHDNSNRNDESIDFDHSTGAAVAS